MKNDYRLDATDRRILRELQKNGQLTGPRHLFLSVRNAWNAKAI